MDDEIQLDYENVVMSSIVEKLKVYWNMMDNVNKATTWDYLQQLMKLCDCFVVDNFALKGDACATANRNQHETSYSQWK